MTDAKKAAALLEQEQSQTKKPETSIADTTPAVKPKITDLASLRAAVGMPVNDLVDVVRTIYPKYDKPLNSKCEHGDEYGIDLRPDAFEALLQKFVPQEIAAAQRVKRPENRKANCRIHARLTDSVSRQFRDALSADGFSIQAWIEKQVYTYLRERKTEKKG